MDSILDLSYELETNGEFKDSYDLNVKALRMSLDRKDNYYTAVAYGYLGFDFLRQGDTLEALNNFKRAQKHALLYDDPVLIADSYGNLASIYSYDSNKRDLEESYTKMAIETYKKYQDTTGLQFIYHNYAHSLEERGDFEKLKNYLDLLNGPKFINNTAPVYRASIDNLSAKYHLELENYSKADSLLLEVIQISTKENLPQEQETAYQYYSESLFEQNRFEQAYATRLKYEELLKINQRKDLEISLDRVAFSNQMIQFKEELKRSEIENELQQEKIRNKTVLIYALATLITVILLGLYFTFQLSRKRKQLNRELKEKNKLYLKEKNRAEKLALAKSDFFSTVSHELRTPLYGVIGLANILLENNKDQNTHEDIKSLKFSADYLLALVNDVLQVNKIDANNHENEQTDFNIKELVQKIVASFEYMRRQNKNVITIDIEERVPSIIHGNAVRLSQILMNLIGNAAKFTENGVITIQVKVKHVTAEKVRLLFSVNDNGQGIANSKIKQIFEEFKQGDSHSYNYQGTGLGLPIVKRLLELSDSEIQLETEEGKGSSFSFELAYDIVDSSKQGELRTKGNYLLDTDILKGKRILIAEDNRINQMVTKKILEKDGVICTVVENGQEAVVEMKNNTYDLILMDINMPVLNGIEATKEIRKVSSIPILALTAVEIMEIRQSISEAGMNDFIVKPYDVIRFKQLIIKSIVEHQNKADS
ncbi:signal transduction histidine kinase [Nonlabens dokdonensis]|uniref:histidine kinase n=2 Tax=Nonlabens dokdonensis TaxID=328515 RepID=L7W9Z6_NONDD|nr:response regulator [Nonlabens dokdonensis]AGC77047.1 sensor protein [Nonlabens dokdonensis DSW-6]PZX41009.1 signal transduction histidine kinase [Nonlabens dokdonensis]